MIPDSHRQILMEMLYRYTGLNNREIGELMALDLQYSEYGGKNQCKEEVFE